MPVYIVEGTDEFIGVTILSTPGEEMRQMIVNVRVGAQRSVAANVVMENAAK
jgi:hypothetical protein